MANPARSTAPLDPLDVLQSTLDGIFIEIGNSLRISDKVPLKTLVANANARLRSTIPKLTETFHQALDDIETDIVRAKAVLLRDLEEARAKRIALENPPLEVVEDPVKIEPIAEVLFPREDMVVDSDPPVAPKLDDTNTLVQLDGVASLDPPKAIDFKEPAIRKEAQGPSPPSSNEVNVKTEAVDLNKTATAEASVDSLLDISADNNNNDDLNINFDDMDFSQFTTNVGENSPSQANDILSTFGNDADFTMPDLHAASNNENSNNNTENKKDELYELADTTTGEDMMDMDFLPTEVSSFEEMFFHAGEDNGSARGNMGHGNLDANFFQD